MGRGVIRTIDSPVILEWGVSTVPFPGETDLGDAYIVKCLDESVLIGVVDGLGHGEEAATAARITLETLEENAQDSITALVKHCHERLRGTRGAVMSLASINPRDQTLSWVAVGNVEGVLARRGSPKQRAQEHMMLRGGLVGFHLPSLHVSKVPIAPGDVLILATDGIRNGFTLINMIDESPQKVADYICTEFSKGTDDALVLVALYKGVRQ